MFLLISVIYFFDFKLAANLAHCSQHDHYGAISLSKMHYAECTDTD